MEPAFDDDTKMSSSSVTVHGPIAPAHCAANAYAEAGSVEAEADSVESADFVAADVDAAWECLWCRSDMDHIIDFVTWPVDPPSLGVFVFGQFLLFRKESSNFPSFASHRSMWVITIVICSHWPMCSRKWPFTVWSA